LLLFLHYSLTNDTSSDICAVYLKPCLNKWKAGLLCEGGGQGGFPCKRSDYQTVVARNQKEHELSTGMQLDAKIRVVANILFKNGE
jgi:hypothetical protein